MTRRILWHTGTSMCGASAADATRVARATADVRVDEAHTRRRTRRVLRR